MTIISQRGRRGYTAFVSPAASACTACVCVWGTPQRFVARVTLPRECKAGSACAAHRARERDAVPHDHEATDESEPLELLDPPFGDAEAKRRALEPLRQAITALQIGADASQ